MKVINNVKIILKKTLNNIFKVENIDKLTEQKEAMDILYQDGTDQLNDIKANKKFKQEQLEKKRNQLQKINNINVKLIDNPKKENDLKKGYELKKSLEKDIDNLKQQVESFGVLEKNLNSQLKLYKTKINKIESNIDELKAKAEFSNSVDKFKNTMKNLECGNINDISNEINKNYYKSEFDLESLTKINSDIEDVINQDDEDFEKYKKQLQKNKKGGK